MPRCWCTTGADQSGSPSPPANPERFAAFVIANTWAWPKSDLGTQLFSRTLGGPLGRYLIGSRNFFNERVIPGGVRRKKLPAEVMDVYRVRSQRRSRGARCTSYRARSSPADRFSPTSKLTDRRALLVWATKDPAFRSAELRRWDSCFLIATR